MSEIDSQPATLDTLLYEVRTMREEMLKQQQLHQQALAKQGEDLAAVRAELARVTSSGLAVGSNAPPANDIKPPPLSREASQAAKPRRLSREASHASRDPFFGASLRRVHPMYVVSVKTLLGECRGLPTRASCSSRCPAAC